MGATGESPRRLTGVGYNPTWSPDGSQVVYATNTFTVPDTRMFSGNSQLFTLNVSTGVRQPLVGPRDAFQPQWSPHGHRIAYWEGSQGQGDIFIIPAAGGTPIQVTSDASLDWNPVWSPNGRYLYFGSDRGGSLNLWRTPIEERSGRVLGNSESLTTPSTYSGFFSLSRDGRSLLYVQRGICTKSLSTRSATKAGFFSPVRSLGECT